MGSSGLSGLIWFNRGFGLRDYGREGVFRNGRVL